MITFEFSRWQVAAVDWITPLNCYMVKCIMLWHDGRWQTSSIIDIYWYVYSIYIYIFIFVYISDNSFVSFTDILLQVYHLLMSKTQTLLSLLNTNTKVALMCHQNRVKSKFPMNLLLLCTSVCYLINFI